MAMNDHANGASLQGRILEEGRTCWRIAPADRVAVLIDSECYFRALLECFRQARSRIMILGWDFAPTVRLVPGEPDSELRRLLPALVQRHPTLDIRLLIWDVAPIYGPSPVMAPLLDTDWQDHPRIHFRFDSSHPAGASHHEKIICVDDVIAFVGGIDLTVCRWDTQRHDPADSLRASPDGEPYEPVHDVQMAVTGQAAASIAELARTRWRDAGGHPLTACHPGHDIWPATVAAWPVPVRIGIARTRPRMQDRTEVNEIAQLNASAFDAACRSVYLETQYLSSGRMADRLVALLERPEPPEIVILVWNQTTGWLERFAMGGNRDRLLRRLAAADHRGRLRVYRRTAPGAPGLEVAMHAKVIIVDDRFLRVGSSNLNNRSLGVDTECDLAVEATDTATCEAIAQVRDSLLAEHLACPAGTVRQMVAAGGLIGAIEILNPRTGTLQPYTIDPGSGPTDELTGTALLDPCEPLDLDYLRNLLRHQFLTE